MSFRRRPYLMGNTSSEVMNQPYISGHVHKNSDNKFDALVALGAVDAELHIATDVAVHPADSINVTFAATSTISEIVDAIHAMAPLGQVLAEEREGCLVIKTPTSGEGAYVEIHTGLTAASEAAPLLGIPQLPHPSARAVSGMYAPSPVRPLQENNPQGSAFIAFGEDRIAGSYNRALNILGMNLDRVNALLSLPVAVAVTLEIDETAHASRLVTDITIGSDTYGHYTEVSLGAHGDSLDALFTSPHDVTGTIEDAPPRARVYVGTPQAPTASLTQIGEYFAILDTNDNEIPVFYGNSGPSKTRLTVVRVGAVTRGSRGSTPLPTVFVDDLSSPVGFTELPNTADDTPAPDGGSVLGVLRRKVNAAVISSIEDRTLISCSAATFITDKVRPGDVATISGATGDLPFSHNGSYRVGTVHSETKLELLPVVNTTTGDVDVQELNPDVLASFGTVTITTDGLFEEDVFLSFHPPLPRFPEDGKLRIVVGIERPLGSIKPETFARSAIASIEEVDKFVLNKIWNYLSIGGVYQGQGNERGGGFYGSVTNRPITLGSAHSPALSIGTLVRSGEGFLDEGLVFQIKASDAVGFTPEDVGRTMRLTIPASYLPGGGTYEFERAGEPWAIAEYLDRSTVRLAPPVDLVGIDVNASVPSPYYIYDDEINELNAAMAVVAPEYYGLGKTTASPYGYLYVRTQPDGSSVPTAQSTASGLYAFVALEQVRDFRDGRAALFTATLSSTPVEATVEVTSDLQTPTGSAAFDPSRTSNIYPEVSHESRGDVGISGRSLLRIRNGEYTGFYRILNTTSAAVSGTNGFKILNLDGTVPSIFSMTPISCSVYNVRFAVGHQIKTASESTLAGLTVFGDSYEGTADRTTAIQLNWRGSGAGITAHINDPNFIAQDDGDGAVGALLDARVYSPARGLDITSAGNEKIDTTGVVDRGSNHGIIVRFAGYKLKREEWGAFNTSEPLSLTNTDSAGIWTNQMGTDPGVIITGYGPLVGSATKYDPTLSALPSLGRISTSSSLVVTKKTFDDATANPRVSPRGEGAVEVVGSIYQRRGQVDIDQNVSTFKIHDTVWDGGGIYTESGIGAGRFLYPMTVGFASLDYYTGVVSADYGNAGIVGYGDTSAKPTRLGTPGRVFPVSKSDSGWAVALGAPDFSIFNIPHSGYIQAVDAKVIDQVGPASALIGLKVVVAGTDSFTGPAGLTVTAFQATIVAVDKAPLTGGARIAFLLTDFVDSFIGDGVNAPEPKLLGVTAEVWGSRWFESHVDIADWTQIGTKHFRSDSTTYPVSITGDLYKAPFLTVSSEVDDYYTPAIYSPDTPQGDRASRPSGRISLHTLWHPNTEGTAVFQEKRAYGSETRTPLGSSGVDISHADWEAISGNQVWRLGDRDPNVTVHGMGGVPQATSPFTAGVIGPNSNAIFSEGIASSAFEFWPRSRSGMDAKGRFLDKDNPGNINVGSIYLEQGNADDFLLGANLATAGGVGCGFASGTSVPNALLVNTRTAVTNLANVASGTSAMNVDFARVHFRGSSGFNEDVYGYRVTLKVTQLGGEDYEYDTPNLTYITVPTPVHIGLSTTSFDINKDGNSFDVGDTPSAPGMLTLSDGNQFKTVLVNTLTDGTGTNTKADNFIQEVVVEFSRSDIYAKSFDSLDSNAVVHAVVKLGVAPSRSFGINAQAHPSGWLIHQCTLETLTRPARVTGPLEVNGAIMPHMIRYRSPVQGFVTVSPARVTFLDPSNWGSHTPKMLEYKSDGTGVGGDVLRQPLTSEGRGVGAIKRTLGSVTSWVDGSSGGITITGAGEIRDDGTGTNDFDLHVINNKAVNPITGTANYGDGGLLTGAKGEIPYIIQQSMDGGDWNGSYWDGGVNRDSYRIGKEARGTSHVVSVWSQHWQIGGIIRMSNLASKLSGAGTSVAGVTGSGWIPEPPTGETRECWLVPCIRHDLMFKRGHHSATVEGGQPVFDPLWYSEMAIKDDAIHQDKVVYPGRTGFMVDIDAPHGSMMTGIHLNLSFRPCSHANLVSDPAPWAGQDRTYMVWHTCPDMMSDHNNIRATGNWDQYEGVKVTLWRYKVFDDVPGNIRTAWGSTKATTGGQAVESGGKAIYGDPQGEPAAPSNPEAGYAERVWTKNLDIGPDHQAGIGRSRWSSSSASPTGVAGELNMREYLDFTKGGGGTDLVKGFDGARKVDRRIYAYFLTVEFWIGAGRLIGTQTGATSGSSGYGREGKYRYPHEFQTINDSYRRLDGCDFYTPRMHAITHLNEAAPGLDNYEGEASRFRFEAVKRLGPASFSSSVDSSVSTSQAIYPNSFQNPGIEDPINTTSVSSPAQSSHAFYPPAVRFRGMRVDYVTDRGGDGGWG